MNFKQNIAQILYKFYRKLEPSEIHAKYSFSQQGEDLLIRFLTKWILGINNPTYIDIGAHHPFYLSNTFHFYKSGSKGMCIEPDPYLFSEIVKHRPNDISLNIGIGNQNTEADFYILSTKTLNTFSKPDADAMVANPILNQKIEKVIKIPLRKFSTIIDEYFQGNAPDILSIDVEGLDLQILNDIDFNTYRPMVICVESVTYVSDKNKPVRNDDIYKFLKSKGYTLYADTYINQIFVDAKKF